MTFSSSNSPCLILNTPRLETGTEPRRLLQVPHTTRRERHVKKETWSGQEETTIRMNRTSGISWTRTNKQTKTQHDLFYPLHETISMRLVTPLLLTRVCLFSPRTYRQDEQNIRILSLDNQTNKNTVMCPLHETISLRLITSLLLTRESRFSSYILLY